MTEQITQDGEMDILTVELKIVYSKQDNGYIMTRFIKNSQNQQYLGMWHGIYIWSVHYEERYVFKGYLNDFVEVLRRVRL